MDVPDLGRPETIVTTPVAGSGRCPPSTTAMIVSTGTDLVKQIVYTPVVCQW
jgi:hypothetical protein